MNRGTERFSEIFVFQKASGPTATLTKEFPHTPLEKEGKFLPGPLIATRSLHPYDVTGSLVPGDHCGFVSMQF